jgi:hypothetical protein
MTLAALRRLRPSRIGIESKSTTTMQTEYRWNCSCGVHGSWTATSAMALAEGLNHEDVHEMETTS